MIDDPRIQLIDRPEDVVPALTSLEGDVVGVDVERADSDRYFRKAALVQVGDANRCVLIDTVAITDLADAYGVLADRTAVVHACENDIIPLDTAGMPLRRIADTSVAASLLGLPIGLGPLLEELLGIELTSDKERFQRADWERRPLSEEMAVYAAEDVFHLPALWAELSRRLDEAGRREWYEQELEATIAHTLADTRDWTRTRGMGRLDPQQRAVLRALWEEREAIAQEFDIAPNRLVRDDALVDLSSDPAEDEAALLKRGKRRNSPLPDHVERMFAAQQSGLDAPPETREQSSKPWSPHDRDAYDAMRKARARVADSIGLDSGVLCPSKPLWGAIQSEPENGVALCEAAGLRPWQTELLADDLWEAYTGAYPDEDPEDASAPTAD